MANNSRSKVFEGSANREKGKSFQSKQSFKRRKTLLKQQERNRIPGAGPIPKGPTRNPSSKVSRSSRPVPTGKGRMS